jgi:hypothetical protein
MDQDKVMEQKLAKVYDGTTEKTLKRALERTTEELIRQRDITRRLWAKVAELIDDHENMAEFVSDFYE